MQYEEGLTMPITTRGLIERIKDNEKNLSYLKETGSTDRILGKSNNGTYIGMGRPQKVIKEYKAAGVSPQEAIINGKNLYGKELVVGYGHMLKGRELKEYFNDPKKREYYDNLSNEDAEELLKKDVKSHQRYTDSLLEENKIKKDTLSKYQYNTLVEMTFQLGPQTFKEFNKFWEFAKKGEWEEAAQEIKYGATRDQYSNLYKQAKDRSKLYMKDIKETKQPIDDYIGEVDSGFPSTEINRTVNPFNNKEIPAEAGTPYPSSDLNEPTPEDENAEFYKSLGLDPTQVKDAEEQDFYKNLGLDPNQVTDYEPMSQGEAAAISGLHTASLGQSQKLAGLAEMYGKGIQALMPETPETADVMFGGGAGTMPQDLAMEAASVPDPKRTAVAPSDAFKKSDFMEGQRKYKSRLEQAHKDWSKTAMASGLLGGIATGVLIPGSTVMKGASLANKMKTAGQIGAIEGAIMKGGESMAEDLPTLAKDMSVGGMWGAGFGSGFGALAHGGGKLWKKMTGLGPEDAAKASLLADDTADVALVNAEKRARKELAYNNEMLKSIKGFGDKAKEDQLKFLKLKVKDAPNTIKAWAKTLNPEALAKYAKDEPLNIPPRILKMAKKNKLDPKMVHAYYNWRNDMFNYMKFINDVGGRADRTQKDILKSFKEVGKQSARNIMDEIPTFKKNMKAGLVNSESYSEFKMQQYLAEELQNLEDIRVASAQIGYNAKDPRLLKAVEDEAREKLTNDPLRHLLFRKLATVSNAAEVIDDKAGTRVLDTVQDLYVADKQKTGFTRAIADNLQKTLKIRDSKAYSKLTDEQIVKMIESGDDDPLANSFRSLFKQIREYANENGLKIDEYKLGQDKYVPMKRKGAAELVESIQDKWKEIKEGVEGIPGSNKDEINKILRDKEFNPLLEEGGTYAIEKANREVDAFRKNTLGMGEGKKELGEKLFGAVDEEAAMPEFAQDIRHIQNLLGETFNREILDFDMMERAIAQLQTKDNIRALLTPALRNVHERTGTLPMWARELDIGKMAIMDADAIGDLIFKRPVLDKLDTQIMLLKMKGFNNSADYLNNLKKDILGITRKGTEDRQIKSVLRELTWKKKPIGKLALGLENAVTSAIYPNYLGFNARAIVRNLTQPYSMTARELGVGVKGDVLALNSTRKMLREGMGKAQKRFSKLGLLDQRDPTSADFEGMKAGLRHYFKDSKIARKMDRGIDKYSDAAMAMYAKTDTINRLITAQMAEDIGKLVKAGKTNWLKNAPKQVQAKVKRLIEEGADQDEFTKTIGKWLQVKTQLNYAKDDMYEFGREMGPLFAMLSKWPTAVTSDIATKIMKDGRAGAARAATKYLSPLLLVSVLQNGLDSEIPADSLQNREMFGYGGLNSWLPVSSVFGIADTVMPIPADSFLTGAQGLYSGATDGLSGRWDREDTRQLQKNLQKLGDQFVPVAGGASKTWRHFENLTGEGDKKLKKQKKKRKKKY